MASRNQPNPPSRWPEAWTAAEWTGIESVLRQADPAVISDAFARLVPNFANACWLQAGHRIGGDPRKVRGNPPHQGALADAIAEYVAASVPLHLADAWTYFGRGMSAISAGAIEVAQHLLYYSELRAAQALLFRHGVVLLNKKNFVLATTGTTAVPIPNPTLAKNSHQAIWVIFRQWIKTPVATSFCGEVLSLRGETLAKWARERPQPASIGAAIGPLMEQWGMDIARFSRDRELRNQLSYNPTRMQLTPTGLTPRLVADLFQQVWMLLEPEPSNAFESLDRHIARHAFEAFAMQARPGSRAVLTTRAYESLNADWVARVLGPASGTFITEFLRHPRRQPDPDIIAMAGIDLTRAPLAEQVTGMIGRALILLRFATGATRDLLTVAGCSASQVEFWLEDMLTLHGIRVPAGSPRDYMDLYAGIDDLVTELDPLLPENDPVELALIAEEYAHQFQTLAGFERVPAWGVA